MAMECNLRLQQGQGFARCDTQLPFDQVQAGHGFCHRMFHLQAGVHLHEVKLAAGVQQELQRARAFIAQGLNGLHGSEAHALAQGR